MADFRTESETTNVERVSGDTASVRSVNARRADGYATAQRLRLMMRRRTAEHRRPTTHRSLLDLPITPSAIGGSIVLGAVLGLLIAPPLAVAGVIVGGIAGEVFDLRVAAKNKRSDPTRKSGRASLS